MEYETLKTKILDFYASGDNQALQHTVRKALGGVREKGLRALEEILDEVDGKVRLKLLEIMMLDGGSDLISIFIECIRKEKNLLYAKSQILLFRGFKHQEALPALLSLEKVIDKDLLETFQRALGKLLSRFSEQFYMSEFRAGEGDRRRVKFAVDMMLRSPHPSYTEFLSRQILDNDFGYRREGIRALRALGDAASLEALFNMLGKVRRQIRAGTTLEELLFQTTGMEPESVFNRMVEISGLNWSEMERAEVYGKVLSGEMLEPLEQLLDAFDLYPHVRKKVMPYLRSLFSTREYSNFDERRAAQAMEDYLSECKELAQDTARTMGEIAVKTHDPHFIRRMEQHLPSDEEGRDGLLIHSLAGYQTDESFELLCEYINTCDDKDLLENVLDALKGFTLDEIPAGIERLCTEEDHALLRGKALYLVGRSTTAPEILGNILQKEDGLAVRADVLKTIADCGLKGCYPLILTMLQEQQPDSLLIAGIEALRAFPGERSGRAVRNFMLPPHTATIRKAALETLFEAGGPDRIELILKALSQDSAGKLADVLESFIQLLIKTDCKPFQPTLFRYRDFWQRALIEDPYKALRTKIIKLFEGLDYREHFHTKPLLSSFKNVLKRYQLEAAGDALTRLSAFVEQLEASFQDHNLKNQRERLLNTLLDSVEKQKGFQQIQALRKLAQSYRVELLNENPVGTRRLVTMVTKLIDHPETNEVLLQGIALAGKIRHPKLLAKIRPFVDNPQIAIRNAVQNALKTGVDPIFIKPIKSVFVMDDSKYITKQLSKVLAQAGYSVDYENDVDAGLDRLPKGFDLLVLDLNMPKMNGDKFLTEARVREIAPDFTLLITSTRDQEALRGILACGVDGVLLKPFRMDELLERIKTLTPSHA